MKALGSIAYAAVGTAVVLAVFLLLPAGLVSGGTWIWPDGLAAVAVAAAMQAAGAALLSVLKPASLEVRNQSIVAAKDKKQPLADKVVSVAISTYFCALLVFMPLDVFWLRLLPQPSRIIAGAGACVAMIGLALMYVVLLENEFAAPNVQDQSAQGQRLIDKGLYGLVRHPFYAAGTMMICGLSLWLKSYAALIAVSGLMVFLLTRIVVEEAYLRQNLAGYVEYTKRVRSRLIPFLF